MKAYYEYEDGTFWAILTAGGDCFTSEGCKYNERGKFNEVIHDIFTR